MVEVLSDEYQRKFLAVQTWAQEDESRSAEFGEHLLAGMALCLDFGNEATAAAEAAEDPASKQEYWSAVVTVGALFDNLHARHHAFLTGSQTAPRAC